MKYNNIKNNINIYIITIFELQDELFLSVYPKLLIIFPPATHLFLFFHIGSHIPLLIVS